LKAHRFVGSCSTIAIDTIIPAWKIDRKTEVSGYRYEPLQKFFAISTCFKMLRFCGGKGTDFLDKKPSSLNLNVSTHKD
jgi:hypothetical protein